MAKGSTTDKWYATGYSAGMRDMRDQLVHNGLEGMMQWLMDNHEFANSDTKLHEAIAIALDRK